MKANNNNNNKASEQGTKLKNHLRELLKEPLLRFTLSAPLGAGKYASSPSKPIMQLLQYIKKMFHLLVHPIANRDEV